MLRKPHLFDSPLLILLMAHSTTSTKALKASKPVHTMAKAASAKWAALGPGKPKAQVSVHSSASKSSSHKRQLSISTSLSDEEMVVTKPTKKKKHITDLKDKDEVVTEPNIEDEESEQVDDGEPDSEEEETDVEVSSLY